MRQWCFTLMLTGLLLISAATSRADLYQYTDDTGRLFIVDNPALIPQRIQPRVLKEPATTAPASSPRSVQRMPEATPQPDNVASVEQQVPIILRGKQVIVPTTVMMKRRRITLNLLLDTGASITLLDRKAAKKLKLKHLRSATGRLADGSKVKFVLSQVSRLTVGSRAIDNLHVAVVDRDNIRLGHDGLLGMDVLSRWNYRIDYPNSRLIWE